MQICRCYIILNQSKLPFLFINVSQSPATQISTGLPVGGFFNLRSNCSEITSTNELINNNYYSTMKCYLNMDPNPPFPPLSEIDVLTKVSFVGHCRG